nr:hypothetical protein [uncultured Carboxylicivirga sp.]
MLNSLKVLLYISIFILLTFISQIGGIVFIASHIIAIKINCRKWYKAILLFLSIYTVTTFILVPAFATLGGRLKIKNRSNIEVANKMTIWLNRNYVNKETNLYLSEVSKELENINPNIKLRYLDACFPFFDGFPLLPHLSHNDGKKVDISLIYEDFSGNIINQSKSISGYGVFEEPVGNEFNQCQQCKNKGYYKYDFPKYLTMGRINSNLHFSSKGTRELMQALLKSKKLEKLFIEPHLKKRLGINDSRIRFQGCQSVRHDDHIHIQVR